MRPRQQGSWRCNGGLESARAPDERLFVDPLAPQLVSPFWRLVLRASRLGPVRRMVEVVYDLVGGPGPRCSAIARTRLIDDLVTERVPAAEQVVILGAGYDTRAYRLGALAGRPVYEVDRPAIQRRKQAVIRRSGVAADHVHWVPVDFEVDDLCAALEAAGFLPDRPTFVLWEGVSQYLTASAVDATLAAVRGLIGGDSAVVITYVDERVLGAEGDVLFPEAARWLRGVAARGEPWIWGLRPEEVPAFLDRRGFELVDDVSTAEVGERLSPGRCRASALYRVATLTGARVASAT